MLLSALTGLDAPPVAWSALPVIVLAGRWPLALPTASSESLVIGLDSVLLVWQLRSWRPRASACPAVTRGARS